MNIVARAHGILTDPPAEWARIDGEPGDVIQLLISYVVPLAAIPALSGFFGACLVGVVVPGVGTVRAPVLQGFFGAAFGYVTACATVLLLGLVIDLLAPVFSSRRDFERAFKLVVYSYTPFWLAGIFLLAPGLALSDRAQRLRRLSFMERLAAADGDARDRRLRRLRR